ncbi:peptide deformylase [Paenibacillus hamazuiensis]|uniref:peptide deformylase n=1 Tax=Paenibacillus hamazuiensis TaxID=2936508 RepID=UPI00200CCDA8|nr:peptide deformylase [Paenibacillus hamazuiensis]
MTVKSIVPFGDPILRKKAKPVAEVGERVIKLLDDLTDTLYAKEGRAGLAAPQIGILRRVVVMDCGTGLIELINPEMLEMSGEQAGPEGCLSFPNFIGNVRRAMHVKISTLTRSGEKRELEAEGYLARCIQHEMDHLDGVLFIDRVQEDTLYHEHTKQTVRVADVIRLSNQGV